MADNQEMSKPVSQENLIEFKLIQMYFRRNVIISDSIIMLTMTTILETSLMKAAP